MGNVSNIDIGATNITTLGTITTGTWHGSVIGPIYGGTGVNNGTSTITLGGSLDLIGTFTSTFNITGNTNVTFPTSGTLLTSAGAVTSLTGTSNEIAVSGSTGAITISMTNNPTLPGTAGVTLPQGNTAARAGAAGTIRFNTQTDVFESTVDGTNWLTIATGGGAGVTSINGTANEITASASTGAVTLSITSNPVFPGTGGMMWPTGNTAARAGGAGTTRFNSQAGVFEGTVDGTNWAAFESSATGVISVSGTSGQITATPTTGLVVVGIDPTYVGQSSITTLGTITTGTWGGTTIAVNHGGTGDTSFTAYMPLVGGTTTTGALQSVSTSGASAGYVLTYVSSSAIPTWQASAGGVTSITGTANEITASASTGAVTLSLPSTLIAPGTFAVGDWTINTATLTSTGAVQLTAASGIGLDSGTGNITAILSGSGAGTLGLYNAGNTHYVAIQAGTLSATTTWKWPTADGAANTFMKTDGSGNLSFAAAGSGSGSANTLSVTQAAHGFTVGQVVYYNGTAYALAEATSVALAEAIGVVSTVTSSSVFVITTSGYIPSAAGLTGLTAGDVYWLSDVTAGLLSATEPSTVGNIQKPMLVADSTTSGFVINYRGEVIPATFTLPVSVPNGGTGLASLTPYTILTGGTTSTGVLQQVSGTGTLGQALISQGASALPAWGNPGGIFNSISTNTALVANNTYSCDGGGTLTLTLPTTAAAGTIIEILGGAATGWSIAQNSGQSIQIGTATSTVGATGVVASTNAADRVTLICRVANTTWRDKGYDGFLSVT